MKEVVRVLEDYDSGISRYIILDKPWFNRPTKLTDGYNTLEVMYSNSTTPNEHYYNICRIGPYKFKWLCGTTLTEINIEIENLNKKYEKKILTGTLMINDVSKYTTFSIDYVGERHQYDGGIPSLIEQEIIPLYLEEELVPSQFFGLNDYLKSTI